LSDISDDKESVLNISFNELRQKHNNAGKI